tara:strand:- start:3200 stop:4105 length:906 start_codon:yes stop_codon:yes gene_type:complete
VVLFVNKASIFAEILKMPNSKLITFLKISVILVLLGRAYQFIFFSAPFISLYYYAEYFKPYVEKQFKMTWHEFLSLPEIDIYTDYIVYCFGTLFIITIPFVIWLRQKNYKAFQIPILLSGIGLIFLAVLLTITKNYKIGQFIEYSIQFTTPFILLSYLRFNLSYKTLQFILKLITALTFIGHGLYALGYYPVPGYFVDMVIRIFNCSESFAKSFLLIAGILDFVIAIGIFLPNKTIVKYCLIWAVIWGFSTAMARLLGNFYSDFIIRSLHQNTFEMLYRLPHGLIPLLLLYMHNKGSISKS